MTKWDYIAVALYLNDIIGSNMMFDENDEAFIYKTRSLNHELSPTIGAVHVATTVVTALPDRLQRKGTSNFPQNK